MSAVDDLGASKVPALANRSPLNASKVPVALAPALGRLAGRGQGASKVPAHLWLHGDGRTDENKASGGRLRHPAHALGSSPHLQGTLGGHVAVRWSPYPGTTSVVIGGGMGRLAEPPDEGVDFVG